MITLGSTVSLTQIEKRAFGWVSIKLPITIKMKPNAPLIIGTRSMIAKLGSPLKKGIKSEIAVP